jgi:uncharacterized protein
MPELIQQEVNQLILKQIASELQIPFKKVQTTIELLDDGNTIPFISRYRKEMTGELDETQIRDIEERLSYLRNLELRKQEVIRLIEEQGKLTDELRNAIQHSTKLQEVEDHYRPYRQKRKTRASVAREKGLEPLARWMMEQHTQGSIEQEAQAYVDEEKGVSSIEEAIQGAMDIIAEEIADDAQIRAWMRDYTRDQGMMVTAAKNAEEESVYEMYYQYTEPVRKLPPHRILAINRGEREEKLKVAIEVNPEQILYFLDKKIIKGPSIVQPWLLKVIEDAYKRLIATSIERELRGELTEKAEEQAIKMFAENLRHLLLQAPVKGRVVLGVDPAYRTGCKLAVVDETGKMLEVAVTYPTPPNQKIEEAKTVFKRLIHQYHVNLLVIGNGTASRETEQFVADLIAEMKSLKLEYVIVNEAGASVYSASKLAQTEFPDLDVAERSAISIARRLQDPLAELVKIEPKAIGVGQYQHDVSQKKLDENLTAVVESAVNHVGVDLNTASAALLSYVSGVNATIAQNIVKHREQHGKFRSRVAIQKVARLGNKSYEQCVGFMRISDGDHPLDNTPIHPESYPVVDRLFKTLQLDSSKIGSTELKTQLNQFDVSEMAQRLEVGIPTLRDILESLQRPGRDPRDQVAAPIFRTDVLQIEDLVIGMELSGTVRNVIDFGAFVDIGLKNDGLVHISQLSNRFVKHPTDIVAVGDIVKVWVLSVDLKKSRVSLTMKQA